MPGQALSPRDAYDLWAPNYPAAAHNPVMRIEQAIVEPILRRVRARRALDVGTGSGRYLPVLASTGGRVVGLDFSMAMLSRGDPATRRVCADARHLPFRRAAFDLVNSSLMVGDIADLDAWARELARVLVDGGHLVYSDFHPSWSRNGWRRTFTASDGQEHAVAYDAHDIDQHLAALDAARLRIAAIREPRVGAAPHDGRDAAAVKAFRRRWHDAPVVVVFHAVKESGPR
jgi:malonyl-CoA O-methyltransferase